MSRSKNNKKDDARKAEQSVSSKDQPSTQVQGEAASKDDVTLNALEKDKLEYLEGKIKVCIGSFEIMGAALKAINKDRLYRQDFKTFDDYCERQWAISGKFAYRLIQAYEVFDALQKDKDVDKENLPMNESQVRPLLKLDAEKRSDAWKQAVKDANGSKVTAVMVQKAVDALPGNGKAKTKSSPTKQKLKKIAGLVKKALDESSKLTADQIKEILEEIQELVGKKK